MSKVVACPGCGTGFSPFELDEKAIEVCPECGGLWLEKGQLDSLFDKHEGDLEFVTLDRNAQNVDARFYRDCPICDSTQMAKINFMAYSDIIYDHCTNCGGIYLDRGELDESKSYLDHIEKENREHTSWSRLLFRLNEASYSICK